MIAEVQCIPSPTGTSDDPYRHVDAAIAQVADSGLSFEVGALGTTLEGEAEVVWRVLRLAHEASLADGADSVVTVIKLLQSVEAEPTVDDLVGKHR